KRLVAAVNSVPPALNQMVAAAAGSAPGMEAMATLVHSGFTIVDHDGSIQPLLAESVPSAENGLWKLLPDGRMETTWRIRDGVQWHDGTPFTSADVLFTYQVEEDNDLKAVFGHGYYRNVAAIDAPDPRTIVVTWRQTFIYANLLFGYDGDRSLLPLPRHLLQEAYDRHDVESFLALPYWTAGFVGTGPYKVKDWSMDSNAVFQANDRYVLGRPKIDEIEVKFIRDVNTLTANVLAGTVELTLGRSVSLEEASDMVKKLEGGKMDVAPTGALAAFPQFINTNPAVANVQFRRALLHGVDRQQLVDTFSGGLSSIAHTFINPLEQDYKDVDPSVVKYAYDLRTAAQLMEGLGYAKAPDGLYNDSSGQRLAVEARGNYKPGFAVADEWKRFGVEVDAFAVPPQRAEDVEYRSTFPALEFVVRGNFRWDLNRVLGSNQVPLAENRWQGGNRGRYQNADLDGTIARYAATIPLSERNALLSQIVQHVSDQVVILFLFNNLEPTIFTKRVTNVHAKFERSTQAWNVTQWDLV
ncbi:MAG: hypothetical protein HW416_2966, partial [Chloroflexi bacterium]|nr:hypothetical protein [Chloroflexota bacterium]